MEQTQLQLCGTTIAPLLAGRFQLYCTGRTENYPGPNAQVFPGIFRDRKVTKSALRDVAGRMWRSGVAPRPRQMRRPSRSDRLSLVVERQAVC